MHLAAGIVRHSRCTFFTFIFLNYNADKTAVTVIDNLINIPDFTLSDIAKITSYSERQISRIISKHYGLTLLELRRRIKADNRKGE